jgi:hypothetical protein
VHPLVLLALAVTGLYWAGFLATRVHMFQFAYSVQQQKRDNDKWLLRQCSDDAFYHNMKHHSDICEQASHESQQSTWLAALDHVVRNTHACGYQSCVSILEDALTWALSRGMLVAAGAAVVLILLPTLTLPLLRLRSHTEAKLDRRTLRYAAWGPMDT